MRQPPERTQPRGGGACFSFPNENNKTCSRMGRRTFSTKTFGFGFPQSPHAPPPSQHRALSAGGLGWASCWGPVSWARPQPPWPPCRPGVAFSCTTLSLPPSPSWPCCASCCCRRAGAAGCPCRCRMPTVCAGPHSVRAAPAQTTCRCCRPPPAPLDGSGARTADRSPPRWPRARMAAESSRPPLGPWLLGTPPTLWRIKASVELGVLTASPASRTPRGLPSPQSLLPPAPVPAAP